jgi:hypothetical protein
MVGRSSGRVGAVAPAAKKVTLGTIAAAGTAQQGKTKKHSPKSTGNKWMSSLILDVCMYVRTGPSAFVNTCWRKTYAVCVCVCVCV